MIFVVSMTDLTWMNWLVTLRIAVYYFNLNENESRTFKLKVPDVLHVPQQSVENEANTTFQEYVYT